MNHVAAVQTALNSNGAQLDVDGHMGPKTVAALKAFQKQHHLKVTGKLDRATAKALGVQPPPGVTLRRRLMAGFYLAISAAWHPSPWPPAATTFSLTGPRSRRRSASARGAETPPRSPATSCPAAGGRPEYTSNSDTLGDQRPVGAASGP